MVQQVARELAGRLATVQVNIDENPQLARRFNIRGIPALVLLKGGVQVDAASGALDPAALRGWLARHGIAP